MSGFPPANNRDPGPPITIDCEVNINTDDAEATQWCDDNAPMVIVRNARVLLLTERLVVTNAGLVTAQGGRALTWLVYGDADIDGIIDVSAEGERSGPGECENGTGGVGGSQSVRDGGGGGGGHGERGERGGDAAGSAGGERGEASNNDSLIPLVSGCPGGNSTDNPNAEANGGGAGGALQLSVAGTLRITGNILANGGGGGGAIRFDTTGGGGGGSGGSVLIESTNLELNDAIILANGGGGGAGADFTEFGDDGEDGRDDNTPAGGGLDETSGGDGGTGLVDATEGAEGGNGAQGSGGGGGGGGIGLMRVNVFGNCAVIQSTVSAVISSGGTTQCL